MKDPYRLPITESPWFWFGIAALGLLLLLWSLSL